MKTPKIVGAMNYLDEQFIADAALEKVGAPSLRKIDEKPKTRGAWLRVTAVVAASIAVLSGGIITANLLNNTQGVTVVAFDVNPSMEIEVDSQERVVKVTPLNEDARKVVGDMRFEKVELGIAVDALISSMLRYGYLTTEQNSILISVSSSSSKQSTTLRREISDSVSAILTNSNIQASVLTQSFKKTEKYEGVSSAKEALIQKIIRGGLTHADGSKYTHAQLSKLRVHELKLMLEYKGFYPSGVEFSGKASEENYIGKEQALSIAYDRAGVTAGMVRELEVELDFDDDIGGMVYEVEFVYENFEYEYELNAITGFILEEEIEPED